MTKLNILPENPEEETLGRFPSWLHRKLPPGGQIFKTNALLDKYRLNTVCEEAKCPNRLECYTKKTATFLALGKECTRNCGFCSIDFNKTPRPPEADEPERIALSVRELGLKHAVITMVARDDLPDQGAGQIAAIIRAIRKENPTTTIEVLTSDFSGDLTSATPPGARGIPPTPSDIRHPTSDIPLGARGIPPTPSDILHPTSDINVKLLYIVLDAQPEIFNHNIETVRALSSRVRHKAEYGRTLAILKQAKESGKTVFVKSGLMVGLGETPEQVEETLRDLAQAGCDIITIGQYLQPDPRKLRVKAFIHPDQFKAYEDYGRSLGVRHMYCGPFVRSSYNANLFAPGLARPIDS